MSELYDRFAPLKVRAKELGIDMKEPGAKEELREMVPKDELPKIVFVMGGGVKGGRVLSGPGGWSGLSLDKLHEERDLAVRTDYRDVLADVLRSHLSVVHAGRVFPGIGAPTPLGLFG